MSASPGWESAREMRFWIIQCGMGERLVFDEYYLGIFIIVWSEHHLYGTGFYINVFYVFHYSCHSINQRMHDIIISIPDWRETNSGNNVHRSDCRANPGNDEHDSSEYYYHGEHHYSCEGHIHSSIYHKSGRK